MLRLKRHIVTEIIEVFLAVILVLTLIMISFRFAELLGKAAAGDISGGAIYQLLALQAVNLAVLLTPFAFFISALVALSRLAGDNELIAMRSIGYGDSGVYSALFCIALPLSLLTLFLSLFVVPKILSLNYNLIIKAEKESEISIIQPGNFRQLDNNTTVYIADINNNVFSDFFIVQSLDNGDTVIVAKHGEQINGDENKFIELQKGGRYHEENNGEITSSSFERLEVMLPQITQLSKSNRLSTKSTTFLYSNSTLEHRLELQRRLSPSITILLLAILTPLLVQFNPRANRYGKFVIAILAYAIYTNSQFYVQALIERGSLPLIPGMYLAHIIFFILWLAIFTYKRQQLKQRTNASKHNRAKDTI